MRQLWIPLNSESLHFNSFSVLVSLGLVSVFTHLDSVFHCTNPLVTCFEMLNEMLLVFVNQDTLMRMNSTPGQALLR